MSIGNVSVVIPNYNRVSHLRRALESVKNQTVSPLEVIIIDDSSSAENLTMIRAIVDEFSRALSIRLLINGKNCGANYSRNRGIREAKGQFIAFLDSDDLWMPKKLEIQLKKIEETKALDSRPVLSATGRYRVDDDGNLIACQFGGISFDATKIKRSNFVGTLSSVVVEKWIARHIHGFDESLPACQDWDLYIRLSEYIQFVGIRDPLCVYVDHSEGRITLNNRQRLLAHIHMHRMYLRDAIHSSDPKSQFYRNISEDLQAIGKLKKAKLYYAKSKLLVSPRIKLLRDLEYTYWHIYYYFFPLPPIKRQRYDKYKKSLLRIKSRKELEVKLTEDTATIRKMMASNDRNVFAPQ